METAKVLNPVVTLKANLPNGGVQLSERDIHALRVQMEMHKWPRVMIGVPLERTIRDIAFQAFIGLAVQHPAWTIQSYTRCDIARNRMAMSLLEDERFTHLVMLDSDHVHPTDTVQRLVAQVQAHPDWLVVAGLNFRRGEPYDPCVFFKKAGEIVQPDEFGGVVITDPTMLVGTGSIIIAREVFEQMLEADPDKPFFGYEYKSDWRYDGYSGVDIWFCRRCIELGIPVYCDTANTSPHIGDLLVDESTYRTHQKEVNMEMAQVSRIIDERRDAFLSVVHPGPAKTLYVGANKRRFMFGDILASMQHEMTVLEVFLPYAKDLQDDTRVRHVVVGDVVQMDDIELPEEQYDYAIWLHGPEHVKKEDGVTALHNLEHVVRPGGMVVVGCPWGNVREDGVDGNPRQRHISAWYPEELGQAGYTVAATLGEADTPGSSILAYKIMEA